MQIDPRVSWWIGLVVTIVLIGANGAVWTDTVPAAWVPALKGWCNLGGLIGTAVLTYLHGVSSNDSGPLAG